MSARLSAVVAVLSGLSIGVGILPGAAQAGGPDITPTEYQHFMDWKDGREDERLAKLDESGKLKRIAKSLGLQHKELQQIIDKVSPLAASLEKDSEAAISEALKDTPLKGRVGLVDVNAETGHVVAWVEWKCGDPRDIDKEAVYAAWAVGDSGKVVRTLVLYCTNEAGTKLFSAKAAHTSLTRINKSTIERFASSRYVRLLEDVKRGPHK